MFKFIASALLLVISASAFDKNKRDLGYFRNANRELKITVTNIAYQQPMSPFFYMVHNGDATPLFELGTEASSALQTLVEAGDTTDLETVYNADSNDNVQSSGVASGVPPGQSTDFTVTVNRNFPYISFASMAVNTNDCFVGINSQFLYRGQTISVPGYDSGTEENNELCSSIPGPACAQIDSGNVMSENGEGFVHVHRGIHGVGDLNATDSDWRNPMLLVTVE